MGNVRQTVENLKGEVEFRRKLARQHTTGEVILPDYFGKDEHDQILLERIQTTESAFGELERRRVDFSAFLELGAERGHRALVLSNRFLATGIAADLSLDQLRSATHFAEQFGLPKVPLRVCCDANRLPFRSGSVPFVFVYQFLHHFPELDGVMEEIHRILGVGSFFFDEEPLGRVLQWNLYKQGKGSRAFWRKIKLLRWLEGFLSEAACDEVEHGIVENHAMKLPHWQENLGRFDDLEVRVRTLRYIRSRVTRKMRPANFLNHLLGGVIYGLCRKNSPGNVVSKDPWEWLCCPVCRSTAEREGGSSPRLTRSGDVMVCEARGCRYPVIDDIPVLIEPELRRELYPEIG